MKNLIQILNELNFLLFLLTQEHHQFLLWNNMKNLIFNLFVFCLLKIQDLLWLSLLQELQFEQNKISNELIEIFTKSLKIFVIFEFLRNQSKNLIQV